VFYLFVYEISGKRVRLSLLCAFLMTISPWHLQYSRAGFEVTQLLFFLLLGLWLFYRSLYTKGQYLWLSVTSFLLMPWIYSTAKLFTPFLLLFLFIAYFKDIFSFSKKTLFLAVIAGVFVGLPITYSTVFGGGTARFSYLSIFTDPSIEPQIGYARSRDLLLNPTNPPLFFDTVLDRFFHNKYQIVLSWIRKNYFETLSSSFLFEQGDSNLRHTVPGMGLFYHVEILPFFIGVFYLLRSKLSFKSKFLFFFWLVAGIFPASLTRDGGTHATRLFLILPIFLFLISFGIDEFISSSKKSLLFRSLLVFYCLALFTDFIFYQHQYWVHYPLDSERWWHYGFEQIFDEVTMVKDSYQKIVIITYDEPPWIFFAGWTMYPPDKWQTEAYPFPIVELPGFGKVSHIDKYYFGSPIDHKGVYDWGKILDTGTLYIASAKEVNVDFIHEPNRIPGDLQLVKAIPFPSGLPAYYLFTKKPVYVKTPS
jgi:hypothetical protein